MDLTTILVVSMLVLCYAIGIFILMHGIRQIRTAFAARSWPSTDARLEKCEVLTRSATHSGGYHLSVKYSYVVAGAPYTGNTVAIGYLATSDRAPHEEARQRVLGLEPFTVRFDPAHPEVSTIFASENALIFGSAAFGLFWLTITVGFTVIVLAISGVGSAMLAQFA